MSNPGLKRTGFLRAGFQYQDLVAIEILIDFYANRNLYDWVELDADDGRFQSIDDVVARRPDGLYELTQVKFAADPDAEASKLSWSWLTKRSGEGRSWLQKWAKNTLAHARAAKLAKAALKTDRIPDEEFAGCLDCSKVIYGRLPRNVKSIVDEQLGSSDKARLFFENFEFEHSKPRLDDLEDQLWSRVAPLTDGGGWAAFRLRVRDWSTRKNCPGPDGKIRYVHLRGAFAVDRGRPIPQVFRVPDSYQIPDLCFHQEFVQEICGSDGITVLWGPPGRGKSTYLSHCVTEIDVMQALCIRHHYSLSIRDRHEDRYSYHAIVQSLVHQLRQAVPDLSGSWRRPLGNLVESAAGRLETEGRRLIVVVDGLDHVWRECRDREAMDMLFDALVPVPTNVRLVVGTQKIRSSHLPAILIRTIPEERWTELPLMSREAVGKWISYQDGGGRLNLAVPKWRTREQTVDAVAMAFHEITQGLPLHLIYSFEALVESGAAVTQESVSVLPACPSGEIRDYYRGLWNSIGPKAQSILHVLAGLRFGPPPFALSSCFGGGGDSLEALAAIAHLMDRRATEVQPFHSSLFGFVRELPDHDDVFRQNVVDTVTWLETDAPEYWRWAWLWITQAQLGDSSQLLGGPSRDWAIRSLVSGFPIEQIVNILNEAEIIALEEMDLPRLLYLRCLKSRAIKGPEHQTHDWPLFLEVAASLSEDPLLVRLYIARLDQVPSGFLPGLVRIAKPSDREEVAREAIQELKQRVARTLSDESGAIGDEQEHLSAMVAVAASNSLNDPSDVVAYVLEAASSDMDSVVGIFVREALLASNFDYLFDVAEPHARWRVARDVLAAMCSEGLAPSARPDLKANSHPAICCLALALGGEAERPNTEQDISHLFVDGEPAGPEKGWIINDTVYEVFFSALFEALSGRVASGWAKMTADAELKWLGEAVRALEQLAEHIGREWKSSGYWPTVAEIYDRIDLSPPLSNSYFDKRALTFVRFAIRDIVIDLATIGKGLDRNALIHDRDIESVVESAFWSDDVWLWGFAERRLPLALHSQSAAKILVERVDTQLDRSITSFSERSTHLVQLALFAFDHGLLEHAKSVLSRAFSCVLGYGTYEDPFALEVLESLHLLAESGDAKSAEALLGLAGEFEALTVSTDEEAGRPREQYYKTVFGYYPEKIPGCYAQLIRDGEWYFANFLGQEVLNKHSLESDRGRALLETYILPWEIQAMEEGAGSSKPHLTRTLSSVYLKTGRGGNSAQGGNGNEEAPNTNVLDGEAKTDGIEFAPPDPSGFPPESLESFLEAISNMRVYVSSGQVVAEWLRHWAQAGLAKEALSNLDALVTRRGSYFNLEAAMDAAFEIALLTHGRSKAFRWLVRAQIANGGWKRWHSARDSRVRFENVSRHYREKWSEFIRESAVPVYRSPIEEGAGVIGQHRLVEFLVEVDQMDAARDCALELARVLREEFSDQPIRAPQWST